jgi:hypothetical protein
MAVGRIRTGVILILLGVLLLLNTTGVLDVGVWESILVLWPLLLIAIGIEKIFAATQTLKPLAYLSPLIIVATVGYAVVAAPGGNIFTSDEEEETGSTEWSVGADSAITSMNLRMDFGGGRLKVRGGANADQLIEGQFYHSGRKPETTAETNGETMEVTLSRKSSSVTIGQRSRERWIVKVNETVPVNLSLEAGGAQVRLDLADIVVNKLDLETGAADIDVILGTKSSQVECDVNCGAASIDMVIPAGAGLRVDRQSALSSFSSGDLDLVEKGDFLETPEFDTRSVRILLNIESGVSSFRIRQSDEIRVGTSI